MESLTPCKIETLEHIDTQFVRIDYVHELNVHGGLLGKEVKYNFLCDFFYLFIYFSRTNVEKRPLDGFWHAVAQKRGIAQGCAFLGL